MALASGTHLGPYEITAQIGVGGMGEVYQATDTNLKRSVAMKVLPESVAGDAERLARFQREAEVLAALNHPNIAAIYGLEKSEGMTALVMELVEGPTLENRIAQAAIPIDEALPIAKQIAEALEAAHEQGIIHRDLKPANGKLRPDGVVKVLDFGLAKALEPTGAMSPGMSQAPTITTPAMTQAGVILGTAAYMSPEQAKGRTVDKRSDVWAFGAVLYEMLSGKRAFGGDDISRGEFEGAWRGGRGGSRISYRHRVVTPADAPHRRRGVERCEGTVEDYPYEDRGPPAAALRSPAPGSRPPHRGRDHRDRSGCPALDRPRMAPHGARGRGQPRRDTPERGGTPTGDSAAPATRPAARGAQNNSWPPSGFQSGHSPSPLDTFQRGAAPALDDVALLVEREHRRSRHAAL